MKGIGSLQPFFNFSWVDKIVRRDGVLKIEKLVLEKSSECEKERVTYTCIF